MSAFVEVPLEKCYRLTNSGPVIVVSAGDGNRVSACPVAWYHSHSDAPPQFLLTLAGSHLTSELALASGYLAIGIPTADLADKVLYLGSVSGHEEDKLTRLGLKVVSGQSHPSVPVLTDLAAFMECAVLKVLDEDLILVEALRAEARVGALGEDSVWNQQAFPTLHHLGGKSFGVLNNRLDVKAAKVGQ
jgi:flavin reductase (DIM6/NTAB) family NADH-FMN oxidoreductase RutF